MKKLYAPLACASRTATVAMALALATFGASAATYALHDGLVYELTTNKKTAKLIKIDPKKVPANGDLPEAYAGDITIPSTFAYDGVTYSVTSMAASAFKGQPLTSVVVPEGITSLPSSAFQDCANLATVTLHDKLTKIDMSAFQGCTSLTEFTVPASVTSAINMSQFVGCSSLKKFTFADGTTPLDFKAAAFSTADIPAAIEEVYLGRPIKDGSVAAMADKPFRGMASLKKATISANITTLPASYFENASGLASVEMLGEMTDLGTATFAGTALETVVLPQTVTVIPAQCFANTKSLKTVILGAATTGIDAMAFQNSAVTNIAIPASLTYISDMAFSGAKLSGEMILPAGVTRIGAQAFAKTKLTSITLPESLKTLGAGAFMGCKDLAKFDIAASNEAYAIGGNGAYITDKAGETLLCLAPMADVKSLELGVNKLADYACYGANNLESVKFDNCQEYGSYSLYDTGIKNLTVRGLVGRYVAQNCAALTELTVEGVEAPLGIAAGCTALTKVNLPTNLTVVKQDAFAGTTALKNLDLGNVLVIIEADAFKGSAVETMKVAATYPAAMTAGVFTPESKITVTVPASVADDYKAADGWKYLTIIGDPNLAAEGADMGMPDGIYYAGQDGIIYGIENDGTRTSYDVGGVPHTFQLLEFKNRIYGASAGKGFYYSATGATDGDGKLFYISQVAGQTFQAVVLDNTGNNAYMDPFGLYIYNDTLYVNDRNVCIRKIPAGAISLPQNYPSWMENNWMGYYGAPWSYGCIKAGFAIENDEATNEPIYWLGMKYNGEGIFRFRQSDIGKSGSESEKGKLPTFRPYFTSVQPIFTTFNIDFKNRYFYIYLEYVKAGATRPGAGLYRISLDKLEENGLSDDFAAVEAELIDGSPVRWEGSGTNEHVGISQLAIDQDGEYMYWCYREPTEAQIQEIEEGNNSDDAVSKGKYMWAETYNAENPLHHSAIKRIKLTAEKPEVEIVVPGVEGYGVVAVNYGKDNNGAHAAAAAADLVSYVAGTFTATAATTLDIYNAAGVLVARASLAEGQTYAPALEAGVYVAVAHTEAAQQIVKIVK